MAKVTPTRVAPDQLKKYKALVRNLAGMHLDAAALVDREHIRSLTRNWIYHVKEEYLAGRMSLEVAEKELRAASRYHLLLAKDVALELGISFKPLKL